MQLVGIDIIEINRIKKAVRKWDTRFLNRIYTEKEIELYRGKPSSLAARFAGKEAALKALGTGLVGKMNWKDLSFVQGDLNRPELRCYGEIEKRCTNLNVKSMHVTFSHTKSHAIAVIIFEK